MHYKRINNRKGPGLPFVSYIGRKDTSLATEREGKGISRIVFYTYRRKKGALNIDNAANPLKSKSLARITALLWPHREPLC